MSRSRSARACANFASSASRPQDSSGRTLQSSKSEKELSSKPRLSHLLLQCERAPPPAGPVQLRFPQPFGRSQAASKGLQDITS